MSGWQAAARQGPLGKATAAVLLLVTACTVGPDYSAPQVAVPPAFRNGGAPGPSEAADATSAGWAQLGDPALNALVSTALAANLDIRQAAARLRQARIQARIAVGRTQPSVDASAQGSYTYLSRNGSLAEIAGNLPSGGPIGLPGNDVSLFQTGLDAAWEMDLFGGDRRSVEAARGRLDAAEWTARDASVSVAAEVARVYFEYRLAETRLALAERKLATQRQSLDLAVARSRNGLASSIDQRRAEQRLAATAAGQRTLLADREARLQALAVLVAQPAATLERSLGAVSMATDTPHVPAGLPSDLLRRRPDIRAAERRLAAATADIGVATADLYPRLSLTGGISLVSTALGSLFSPDSLQPTAAARLIFPMFDGGVRRATVDLRRAERDEAYAAYQAAVLGALRDVEVALSRLSSDRARLADLSAAEAASRDAYDSAGVQYRAGLTGGLEFFSAQDDWLSAQDTQAQARAQVRLDIVALNKAMGGGWNEPDRSAQ